MKNAQPINYSNEFMFANFMPHSAGSFTIAGGDKTDRANEPRFFSKIRRWAERAFKYAMEKVNENTKMYDFIDLLDQSGVNCKIHSYCAMD